MVYDLLWTGGFDSTFRLCQLAKEEKMVQPYYIMNPQRHSTALEIKAQQNILDFLNQKGLGNTILPVQYVELNSIPFNIEISNSFETIQKKFFMLPQFRWLSAFSKMHKGIELCNEKPPRSVSAIHNIFYWKATLKNDEFGRTVLDKEKSDATIFFFFGDFSYPILDKTEIEMFSLLKEWGLADVIDLIRFCDMEQEEPCGICPCCVGKWDVGIFSFPKEAKRRYFIYESLGKIDCENVFPFYLNRNMLGKCYSAYVRYGVNKLSYAFPNNPMLLKECCKLFSYLDSLSIKSAKHYFSKIKKINDIFDEKYLVRNQGELPIKLIKN